VFPRPAQRKMNSKSKIEEMCQMLRAWRIVKGFTQEQVTMAIGVDVSNFENGRCEPRLSTLMKLCDFYGLSLSWLLNQIEETDSEHVKDNEILCKRRLAQKK